ncbi:MAG: restriction endonuclease subunit S [Candidatus Marinimicrobia bacterium]|jgi:type I restriction enzyme S subunit|nr:restriction endonuclease subunit S [Candidatus Neomarinimicrobiota bacterium]
MSTYTISNTKLNSNRVFILQKSELEKRLDPQFYKQEYKEIINNIKKGKNARLGNIVRFSSETWNQNDFFVDTFPYIEISEIDTISGEIQNIVQIKKENAASRAKMIVRENDIIVSTTRPNRGAIALIKKEQDFSIASTGFSVIRSFTNKEINREYLFAILRQQIILKQFEQRSSGGNYPAITQEELNNVTIPIVVKTKQEKIINIFKNAFEQKKQNEAETERLLSSIDDYLLGELGINLPEPPENTLRNRMFMVCLNEVSGGNLSPIYFLKQKYSAYTSKYEQYQLKDISNMYQPKTISQQEMSENGKYKVYGANGHIGYYDNYNHIEKEVLITCRGATCGQINLSEPKSWITGNAMVVQLTQSFIKKEYLFDILQTLSLDVVITGSAQPQITRENLKIFKIPIPPLNKQKEITNHISAIRKQAQKLKDQISEALNEASKEIENILLN